MAQVLFEMVRVGNAVKVTAIDPASGTEAVVVGSASLSRYSLEQAALRKLERLLAKLREGR
jgi:hypothetical protein